ncbi:MAG: DUF5615 family PIN-like protein [Candidatus Sumerlaeaceae bacterium]
MKIVVDESVCARIPPALRELGHTVSSVAENALKGLSDTDVWELACTNNALLITRDYHFTNSVRYDPADCFGILFIKHGNITGDDEIALVCGFLANCNVAEIAGHLVSLSRHGARLR